MIRSIYTRKGAAVRSQFLPVLLAVSAFCSISTTIGQTTYTDFNAGAAIINVSISLQTDNIGLKPYGLLVALLDKGFPVHWIIHTNLDFVSDTKEVLTKVDCSNTNIAGCKAGP